MNSRNKALVVGGVLGALVGLLAAWILVRDLDAEEEAALPEIAAGDSLKIGLTVLGLLRQIADLAS
ncbi:MAG: hypothetical protein ACOYZ7_13565 [Chloroflexota bacterium]